MYISVTREYEIVDWLSKHVVETMLGVAIALMAWEAGLLMDLREGQALNNLRIEHIDKAVNNVGANDKTLRQLVEETRTDVHTLKLQAAQQSKDEG